jgi:hypothetical protein
MCPDNYKQLLVGSIILGSIIFFSNHLSLYAQELPETDDSSEETLDITIPSPSLGQGLGEGDTSITAGDIIEEDQDNNGIPFELPFP